MAAQLLQEQKQRVTRHHCRFHVGNLLKFMLVAIQLVYKAVLASAIWQNEPAIHIAPSSLDFLPTQVTTEPGVAFPVCTVSCHYSPIWYRISVAYAMIHLSLPPLVPLVSTFVLSVGVSISALWIRPSVPMCFRFHMYVLLYRICFSLSDFTLHYRLWVPPRLCIYVFKKK